MLKCPYILWRVTVDNLCDIKQLIKQADVVVCGTDSRPSKLLINPPLYRVGRRCCVRWCFFAELMVVKYSGYDHESRRATNASYQQCRNRPLMSKCLRLPVRRR